MRCLNPTDQPVELKSGTTIGTYTGIEDEEVDDRPSPDAPVNLPSDQVQAHLRKLFAAVQPNCENVEQEGQLAQLLQWYADVFSTGEGDVGP